VTQSAAVTAATSESKGDSNRMIATTAGKTQQQK